MRSHGLRQLVDDKSVASCQQTCCKVIVKTCYHGLATNCFNKFKGLAASLKMARPTLTDLLKTCS